MTVLVLSLIVLAVPLAAMANLILTAEPNDWRK